jgi:hypothetical protein
MSKLSEVVNQLKDLNKGQTAVKDTIEKQFTDVRSIRSSVDNFTRMNKLDRLDRLEEQREEKTVKQTRDAGGRKVITPKEKGGMSLPSFGALGGLLAGAGVGVGAAGAGIGAFFTGLAGAEAIMSKFGGGDNLKKLLTNLAEGLNAFSDRDLNAFGALLAGGAIFGAVPGLSGIGSGIGIGAVGVGLGAFFTGLGFADKSLDVMSVDGARLKTLMVNIAEGLSAFSTAQLGGFAALLGGSGLFAMMGGGKAGTLKSIGGKALAPIGMALIGVGIAGFLTALGVGEKAANLLNVDLSNFKSMMTNLAEGLGAFAGRDLTVLGGLLAAGGLFGVAATRVPGLGQAVPVGMTIIGAGIAGFLTAFAGVGAIAKFVGVDGSGIRDIMINLAAGLKPLLDVDGSNIISAGAGLAALGAGMAAFFTSSWVTDLGEGIKSTFYKAWDFLTGSDSGTNTTRRTNKFKELADSLQPLKDIDVKQLDNLNLVSKSIENFADSLKSAGEVDSSKFKNNFKDIANQLAVVNGILPHLAYGGVYTPKGALGKYFGIGELDFGASGIMNNNVPLNELGEKIKELNKIFSIPPQSQDVSTRPTRRRYFSSTGEELNRSSVPTPTAMTRSLGFTPKNTVPVIISDTSSRVNQTNVSNSQNMVFPGTAFDISDKMSFTRA